jgi:hypothetical protein
MRELEGRNRPSGRPAQRVALAPSSPRDAAMLLARTLGNRAFGRVPGRAPVSSSGSSPPNQPKTRLKRSAHLVAELEDRNASPWRSWWPARPPRPARR